MKKLALALSIACAGALAFADTEQWQTSWFTGISSSATSLTDLVPSGGNGSWANLTTDNAEIDDNALVLDLDDNVEALFSVTTDATDTKTAQKISVTGVFTPIASSELPSADDMGSSGKKAQLGFAVVATTDDNSATTYSYQAWVGGDNWVSLGTCTDKDATTDLTITFAYWDSSVTATFAIKNGDTDVDLGEAATQTLTGNALSVATANYKVSSVACTGSGTLSALSGDAQYAVATLNGRNYGTVADAITAAGTSGNTITLVKDPSGSVTIPEGSTVKIDDNGKTAEIDNKGTMDIEFNDPSEDAVAGEVPSGEYTIPVKVSGANVTYTPSDSSKEVLSATQTEDGSSVKLDVQTKTSILEAITIEGATLKSDVSKLRKFLAANCSDAYTKAKTTSDIIANALKETGDNSLTKWQSYALGIATDTTLAPSYATSDIASDKITIALAPETGSITPSGDFTIKYQVTDGSSTTTASSADAIGVPLETGRYTVNVVFSAPEGN